MISAPGFYPGLTPEDYFAEPCPETALTCTGIRLLTTTAPARFAYEFGLTDDAPADRAPSAAQRMGSLVHRLALGKGADYVVTPFDSYRTKEARAWRAEVEASGRVAVTQEQMDSAIIMAAVLRAQIEAVCAGHDFETEVVLAWQEKVRGRPVWCRAMLDVWCPDLLLALDLKTCADAGDSATDRAFAGGYAVQDCWYQRGIDAVTGEHGRSRMPFLFIEKDAPYLTRVVEADEAFRSGAEIHVTRALSIFSQCMATGQWPGFEPRITTPPSWWLNQSAELEFQEAA